MNKNGESYSSEIEGHRKERGVKCYYKIRKAELIHALKAKRLVEHLGGHQKSRRKINKI